ncbi:hypothetical protein K488DRAFT_86132 [Vararia minispora EC-137]|uniref:Uncharacterized protein n=1 Tax=Vararia minispora EC-137 TaxID=1314806 RepID=A0ACB8QJZ9_9AGAM|nr:hypothetical protein K488DRAFT_86132 [Vararia minispora EC-137]
MPKIGLKSSPLSSDETLTEKLTPDLPTISLDQTGKETEPSPRAARKNVFGSPWRFRKLSTHTDAPLPTPTPASPPLAFEVIRRPLSRSASDVSTLGRDSATSAEADELGIASGVQIESARERGRFGWRIGRSGSSKAKVKSKSRTLDGLSPCSVTVEGSIHGLGPILTSPPTMNRSPVFLTSELSPLDEVPKRAASLSSTRKRSLAPLSPDLSLIALPESPKMCKTLRRASAPPEKPARTQPYAGPYNVLPPDVGEWGVSVGPES